MRKFLAVATVSILALSACSPGGQSPGSPDEPVQVTVYSGRSEELVGPILEIFEKEFGIGVNVKYGDTAEMAALILEEGNRSPADLFFAQDAGALGAVSKAGLLAPLPRNVLDPVGSVFRSTQDDWVGISARARVVVYSTDTTNPEDLPDSILGFTDPKWNGKIGWAPTNGSFQAFVTALRKIEGEEAARNWLQDIKANGARDYPKNTPIVEAAGTGEIEVGFVNHYYLYSLRSENPAIKAENHFLPGGDVGSLVNVAGVGLLASSDNAEATLSLVEFLLSADSQKYFVEETFEYPVIAEAGSPQGAPALSSLEPPDIDLADLDDLGATLELLREVGLL
jgi:iron(III) transport system substrate-binding protein